MTYYSKDFNLLVDDRVRISMPAEEPFPAGWAEGKIISAAFYEPDGWYIELDKDNVSPGWQTGYGYFKQNAGATVEKLSSAAVPVYPDYIMQKVRQHLGLEYYDTSRDAEINDMAHNDVFYHCLEWEGIIGYDLTIRGWVVDIYGVTLS